MVTPEIEQSLDVMSQLICNAMDDEMTSQEEAVHMWAVVHHIAQLKHVIKGRVKAGVIVACGPDCSRPWDAVTLSEMDH